MSNNRKWIMFNKCKWYQKNIIGNIFEKKKTYHYV
jgi:hypothetical protein